MPCETQLLSDPWFALKNRDPCLRPPVIPQGIGSRVDIGAEQIFCNINVQLTHSTRISWASRWSTYGMWCQRASLSPSWHMSCCSLPNSEWVNYNMFYCLPCKDIRMRWLFAATRPIILQQIIFRNRKRYHIKMQESRINANCHCFILIWLRIDFPIVIPH